MRQANSWASHSLCLRVPNQDIRWAPWRRLDDRTAFDAISKDGLEAGQRRQRSNVNLALGLPWIIWAYVDPGSEVGNLVYGVLRELIFGRCHGSNHLYRVSLRAR